MSECEGERKTEMEGGRREEALTEIGSFVSSTQESLRQTTTFQLNWKEVVKNFTVGESSR